MFKAAGVIGAATGIGAVGIGVLGAALLLVACGARESRRSRDQAEIAHAPAGVFAGDAASGGAVSGNTAYRIDTARSEIRLLVHRAGPMARFGHNHVIVNRALGGWVTDATHNSGASISLQIPVAAFVVDEAGDRRAAGADFTDAVPDDAKAGTRRNMVSAAVLDAEHFSTIALTGTAVAPAPTPDAWVATMTVVVAGHESTIRVPFRLDRSAGRISAMGTVALRQSALGLTPYSVMLGALQVQDELTIEFHLVASKG